MMRRRLLLFGIACALTLGGWAGVLAAVVCPHASGAATAGEAPHDCCRGRNGADDEGGAGCPMKFAQPGGDHRQQADRHQQQADRLQPQNDDSHGASHATHEEPRAVRASREEPRAAAGSASGDGRVGVLAGRADLCAHCVGSRLPPPSSNRLGAPEAPRRDDVCAAPRAERPRAPSSSAFVREVIPSQGAPPGPARLYVLNSAFLI